MSLIANDERERDFLKYLSYSASSMFVVCASVYFNELTHLRLLSLIVLPEPTKNFFSAAAAAHLNCFDVTMPLESKSMFTIIPNDCRKHRLSLSLFAF